VDWPEEPFDRAGEAIHCWTCVSIHNEAPPTWRNFLIVDANGNYLGSFVGDMWPVPRSMKVLGTHFEVVKEKWPRWKLNRPFAREVCDVFVHCIGFTLPNHLLRTRMGLRTLKSTSSPGWTVSPQRARACLRCTVPDSVRGSTERGIFGRTLGHGAPPWWGIGSRFVSAAHGSWGTISL
jgi:hypothetical protein